MKKEEIIKFLKTEIEPLEDQFLGLGYRASVYLKDGTYLPAVIFRNPNKKVDRAIRRFKEERDNKGIISWAKNEDGYREIVKTFVTRGNKINDYDIEKVEKSPFAFPNETLFSIKGETTMGWTGFVAKMSDGKTFGFGTSFLMEFFQMPTGYQATEIVDIINHSYISKSGEVRSHERAFFDPPEDYDETVIHRERPYFECYIDDL
ncbi:hypothetical protein U6A24_18305 [Aquimarina gracilis]|uniref:Uncharacterized protein n=1 Tax=Aquimarina gracilis TaxID=874422 RepID=A0ABU5ZZW4_9FLAO|nr:hypothetical protein [Aquimarina gracilis]MEB3347434.1 hypothetical protein [Aquimarina gracilis]